MKNKYLAAAVTVTCLIFSVTAQAAEGVINSFYVDSTGKVEVIGCFDGEGARDDTTIIMYDSGVSEFPSGNASDCIMYINQQASGNNGTFYYHFQLNERFSETPYILKVNGGTLISTEGTLREIPSKIYNVADNAMRIGNDIYDIGCPQYTPDNIAGSLARGGNKLYYKIGGEWFNMLAPGATGTSYFVLDNAVPEAEWDAWEIDNYYQY